MSNNIKIQTLSKKISLEFRISNIKRKAAIIKRYLLYIVTKLECCGKEHLFLVYLMKALYRCLEIIMTNTEIY